MSFSNHTSIELSNILVSIDNDDDDNDGGGGHRNGKCNSEKKNKTEIVTCCVFRSINRACNGCGWPKINELIIFYFTNQHSLLLSYAIINTCIGKILFFFVFIFRVGHFVTATNDTQV